MQPTTAAGVAVPLPLRGRALVGTEVGGRYVVVAALDVPLASVRHVYVAGVPPPEGALRQARAHARRRAAEARARGHPLRLEDRPVARVVGVEHGVGGLALTLAATSYFHVVATPVYRGAWLAWWGPGALANGLAVSVVTRTSDGLLVLEQRSDAVAEGAGSYHVKPSGHVHPPQGPAEACFAELEEELAVARHETAAARCLGLVYNPGHAKFDLALALEARLSWEEVRVRRAAEGWEAQRLVPLEEGPQALAAWLARHRQQAVAPGHGALLLYGKAAYGDGWYWEQAAALGARVAGVSLERALR